MYMHMYVYTDSCLKRCDDFHSSVCIAINPGSPIFWTVNDEVVTKENRARLNVEISVLVYDDDGRWKLNITIRVCEAMKISCREGEEDLLVYNISLCKQHCT